MKKIIIGILMGATITLIGIHSLLYGYYYKPLYLLK